MFKKFIQDESGIALGLAVIMILLIGVMGAGLLVFVRNDLEAVIEVNSGQKALDIADSGVQVARQQILSDKASDHYDTDDMTDCDSTEPAPDRIGESWAPVDDDSDGKVGVDRSFAEGDFNVTIQWLNQDPTADASCIAPETTSTPEEGVEYFRVISTGTYGDATRRVEAIYDTYNLDVPRAYYTPGRIILNGSKVCIDSVSLFSGYDF